MPKAKPAKLSALRRTLYSYVLNVGKAKPHNKNKGKHNIRHLKESTTTEIHGHDTNWQFVKDYLK